MKARFRYILAICIGILPVNIIMVWYRLTHSESFSTFDMLLYPVVFGGGSILLILALNRYLLKGKLSDFNPGKGTWYWDILAGFGLVAIYFSLVFLERPLLAGILPGGKPPSQEVMNMMVDLSRNPVLLIIWLGPVVWIGVALFEEIARIFFLNCLWKLADNKTWDVLSIILVSVVTGILHLYQGAFGIVSISIQGLVIGFFYYKFRRIWPLIISHALYDSLQIIMFVLSR